MYELVLARFLIWRNSFQTTYPPPPIADAMFLSLKPSWASLFLSLILRAIRPELDMLDIEDDHRGCGKKRYESLYDPWEKND